MWFIKSKKQTPLTVAWHDGVGWYAVALCLKDDKWEVVSKLEKPLKATIRKLPKQVIDLALETNSHRLRVLLRSEIHSITFSLPEDADPEEIHTALSFEASNEMGVDAHMLRVAAVRASKYQMGADDDMLLVAGFDIKHVEQYGKDCESANIEFDGIGALELSVLARHARIYEDARLLFLSGQNAFYAVPALGELPFQFSVLPFAQEYPADDLALERIEKTHRRFKTHNELPQRVVSVNPLDSQYKSLIEKTVGVTCGFDDFSEFADSFLNHVAWAQVGGSESGCALIGLPKAATAPYRTGAIMFYSFIVFALLYVALQWHNFTTEMEKSNNRIAAWENLLEERKNAKKSSSSVRSQQQKQMCILEILKGEECFPKGLLKILSVLGQSVPEYSRITSFQQINESGYEISGRTRWQKGLSMLVDALNESFVVNNLEMSAFLKEVKTIEGEKEQRFSIVISFSEGI